MRNLGGKETLSNIRFLFDLRSPSGLGCVFVSRPRRAAANGQGPRERGQARNTLVATLVEGTRALTLGDEMASGRAWDGGQKVGVRLR